MNAKGFRALVVLAALGAAFFWLNQTATSRAVAIAKTHLGVPANRMLFLRTSVADGAAAYLTYDGGVHQFVVPTGKAFVVTDVRINTTDIGNVNANTQVTIDFGGRSYVAQFKGFDTFRDHFEGGIVVPVSQKIHVTNQGFSSDTVNVEVEGYLVNGEGLSLNEVPFGG